MQCHTSVLTQTKMPGQNLFNSYPTLNLRQVSHHFPQEEIKAHPVSTHLLLTVLLLSCHSTHSINKARRLFKRFRSTFQPFINILPAPVSVVSSLIANQKGETDLQVSFSSLLYFTCHFLAEDLTVHNLKTARKGTKNPGLLHSSSLCLYFIMHIMKQRSSSPKQTICRIQKMHSWSIMISNQYYTCKAINKNSLHFHLVNLPLTFSSCWEILKAHN